MHRYRTKIMIKTKKSDVVQVRSEIYDSVRDRLYHHITRDLYSSYCIGICDCALCQIEEMTEQVSRANDQIYTNMWPEVCE